jgi:uncharacterized protein YggU (UPF0235/DUF167 family)
MRSCSIGCAVRSLIGTIGQYLWRAVALPLAPTSVRRVLHTRHVRITIRVRPGSARPAVGGEHAGALVVRVSARAVDGKATEAALAAVAAAFGVHRDEVSLVAGASGRTKVVEVADGDPRVLADLLHHT